MENTQTGGLFVLFGASGDLAQRFILPALHQLYQRGQLSDNFAIIGAARTEFTDEEFQDLARKAVQNGPNFETLDEDFFNHCRYQTTDNTKLEDFTQLREKIEGVAAQFEVDNDYVYFYSITPNLYDETTKHLKESGIINIEGNHRVIVEKPFGENLESAEEYHALLLDVFEDDQIFFSDHFAGMDLVQNILATRYFNPIIDGIWNKDYVENVQISLPESLSVGTRGDFYDDYGTVLDMFQNHILQILSFVAMDLPEELSGQAIHGKKVELLQSIQTLTEEEVQNKVIRGQYSSDNTGQYNSYRNEENVPTDSTTDTYFAAELTLDTPRWEGVPFYVRTGKSLIEDFFAVDLVLKTPQGRNYEVPNRISFNIEPKTGLSLVLTQKTPNNQYQPMTTFFGPDNEKFEDYYIPDPYENLLQDALKGDGVLFTTYPEIKEQWRIADSIVDAWDNMPEPDFPNYRANTFGPVEADRLVAQNGHEWIRRVE